jgi:hypothetical protein
MGERDPVVDEPAIEFVDDDKEVIFNGQPGDSLDCLATVDRAGRVVRVGRQEQPDPRGGGLLEPRQVDVRPAAFGAHGHADHLGAEEPQDPLGEQVLGIGQRDPVSGIGERAQHREQAALCASGQHEVPLGVDADRQQSGDGPGAPLADGRAAAIPGVGGRPRARRAGERRKRPAGRGEAGDVEVGGVDEAMCRAVEAELYVRLPPGDGKIRGAVEQVRLHQAAGGDRAGYCIHCTPENERQGARVSRTGRNPSAGECG